MCRISMMQSTKHRSTNKQKGPSEDASIHWEERSKQSVREKGGRDLVGRREREEKGEHYKVGSREQE